MKLPRDLGGVELAQRLSTYGYRITHQTGSHIRLTTDEPTQHHITIPAHRDLRVGTLGNIVASIAGHLGKPKKEVLERLFG